eukprot:CAMPEP_0198213180 /NCGR_PEP_ID=MMETSP1445-20131203/28722_1 /TAXON_ID=36898 /ORGANISM="Pyramimonas sp., Strain CCMP2087" /LENGTH=127 /DNA_ID=CAMNT_0043887791 /DNA_START=181 /DNA_END=564 /DNA_ORIENTATION=-
MIAALSKRTVSMRMTNRGTGSFSKGGMFSKKSSKALHVASAGLPKLPDNLPNIPNPFESEEEKKREPLEQKDMAKFEQKDMWENDNFEYIFKVGFVGLIVAGVVIFLTLATPVLDIMTTAFPTNPGV